MARMLLDAANIANAPVGHSVAKLKQVEALLHTDLLSHLTSSQCPEAVIQRINLQLANLAKAIITAQGAEHHITAGAHQGHQNTEPVFPVFTESSTLGSVRVLDSINRDPEVPTAEWVSSCSGHVLFK